MRGRENASDHAPAWIELAEDGPASRVAATGMTIAGRVAMTDKHTQAGADTGNMQKDPADWVTGDEPMTGAQTSYLKTLSEEAHVDFDATLSKAAASQRIDELQHLTGRGLAGDGGARFVPNDPHVGEDGDHATLSIGPG